MEGALERQEKPFDDLLLAADGGPTLSIKGSDSVERLYDSEFRTVLALKKAQGGILSLLDITDILYGEPDSDLPISNTVNVLISRLRQKIELISNKRFSIETWKGMGWYLSDKLHPEFLHMSAEGNKRGGQFMREHMKGNDNARKKT
ncbi:hypothetical protein A2765_00045 [Candidatus Kaiserbacteria bacterium RIFCSPHIGHO2_01_FULL_56_24]|uniref:OmpR/PhoB-type domain-containing protein n=1 Tax=Candidatus Kaiserbacteria bacterium RIFCSPHIGHO2_01_FULL_56_24 TaxID=1798487 RepID=A0A1F6DGG5_9BACT|nr:MAG: hypothetical protein A2765_00045 [Candidatus Kaiserbacteria bacterium RIFCSPHIGHO2_01_FULL_56_24]